MAAMTTAQRTVTIVNRRGLHARAAAKFVKTANHFKSNIFVQRNEISVPGRSLMGLLTLGAAQEKDITIFCTGSDAEAALQALAELVARGFDEDDSDGT